MANIILVHGMAANEKSWFGVPKFLESEEHTVAAVQLPGHDKAFEGFEQLKVTFEIAMGLTVIPTDGMAGYVSEVVKSIEKFKGEVILIGHSMGGQVITHVAAQDPDSIERLIYLAALLPQEGQSAIEIMLNSGVDRAELRRQLEPYVKKYPDAFASQPPAPLAERFAPPDASDGTKLNDFNKLPRYYIKCTEDEVLPSKHQDFMVGEAEIKSSNIAEIETDHIPQVSKAGKLHEALKKFIDAS